MSLSTTQNLRVVYANSGQFFQHIDVMMNITKTTDPNVERVTTFNSGLTNLAGDKGIYREKKRAVQSNLESFRPQ
jgi:hypothetical protein